jgi:glycosyltransferase involved in cell wall biosynthesis
VVRSLAIGQLERGYRVEVCSVVSPGDESLPLHQALASGGVRVTPVVIRGRRYLREVRTLRAHFGRLAPDIVHTHGYRSDILAGRAARATGLTTVSTVHGFTGGDRKNRFYEWLQAREFGRFDAVVAVSRPLVSRLTARGVPATRIHCIPNAWAGQGGALDRGSARRILGLPERDFVVGWVGRLSREKGADTLLEAVSRIPPGRLITSFLGEGSEHARLRVDAARLAVEDRVRWHGVVADAGRLFAAFDVFVLSSRTEGTPIALFEAMAAGTPVIATAVGGVPDVVGNRAAVLVPAEDPAALATAIVSLQEDGVRRAALVEAARSRLSEEYALPRWLDQYASLYDSLLSAR